MKKIILLLSILFITLTAEAKKIKGQILLSNDTLYVTLFIPFKGFSQDIDFELLQYKIKYLNSKGEKETKKADEIKEIRFTTDNGATRIISLPNTIRSSNSIFMNREYILLKLDKDGPCKIFSYYYSSSSTGMNNVGTGSPNSGVSTTIKQQYLKKENGELTQVKELSFKKDMTEYFKDCSELVKKIEAKELRAKDIDSIVDIYNKGCLD